MNTVQMHAGAISKSLYSMWVCMGDNPIAKAYLPIKMYKPFNNLHLLHIDLISVAVIFIK